MGTTTEGRLADGRRLNKMGWVAVYPTAASSGQHRQMNTSPVPLHQTCEEANLTTEPERTYRLPEVPHRTEPLQAMPPWQGPPLSLGRDIKKDRRGAGRSAREVQLSAFSLES